MTSLLGRAIPPAVRPSRGVLHMLERNLLVYRRIWTVIFSGFFEPLFYLLAVGVGMGRLVGDVTGPDGQLVPYAAFVAPALLASSAMNGAIYESTMNIFFRLRYGKVYDAILATPMRPGDVAVGEITWALGRGAVYAAGFLVVAALLGYTRTWWALAALPAAVLIGFAFAAVGMAATTFMKSWQDFELVQLAVLPMFLFSATFFPLEAVPASVRWLVQLSPLYHAAEMVRAFMLGSLDVALAGHAAVLVAMGLVGVAIASRRLQGLLLR